MAGGFFLLPEFAYASKIGEVRFRVCGGRARGDREIRSDSYVNSRVVILGAHMVCPESAVVVGYPGRIIPSNGSVNGPANGLAKAFTRLARP